MPKTGQSRKVSLRLHPQSVHVREPNPRIGRSDCYEPGGQLTPCQHLWQVSMETGSAAWLRLAHRAFLVLLLCCLFCYPMQFFLVPT